MHDVGCSNQRHWDSSIVLDEVEVFAIHLEHKDQQVPFALSRARAVTSLMKRRKSFTSPVNLVGSFSLPFS
jgi:hypothetical protein